jgi:hypothetical protein
VRTGGCEIHQLPLLDAKDGVEALLVQACQMGQGAERAIAHQHVPRAQPRMARIDLRPILRVPGGREGLQQEARPRMKEGE